MTWDGTLSDTYNGNSSASQNSLAFSLSAPNLVGSLGTVFGATGIYDWVVYNGNLICVVDTAHNGYQISSVALSTTAGSLAPEPNWTYSFPSAMAYVPANLSIPNPIQTLTVDYINNLLWYGYIDTSNAFHVIALGLTTGKAAFDVSIGLSYANVSSMGAWMFCPFLSNCGVLINFVGGNGQTTTEFFSISSGGALNGQVSLGLSSGLPSPPSGYSYLGLDNGNFGFTGTPLQMLSDGWNCYVVGGVVLKNTGLTDGVTIPYITSVSPVSVAQNWSYYPTTLTSSGSSGNYTWTQGMLWFGSMIYNGSIYFVASQNFNKAAFGTNGGIQTIYIYPLSTTGTIASPYGVTGV